MSLKRKSTNCSQDASTKRPKANFFAPRTKNVDATSTLNFKAKVSSDIRIVTWNINGIKSVDEKLLKKYLEGEDPSILILTETKYSKGKPDIMCLKTRFKYQYWGTDPRPGYAGTAVLSKFKPIEVIEGLPTWGDSPEETAGRYVQLEFADVYVVGTYVPNSGENFKTMDMKTKWNTAFAAHLPELDNKKPVIWAGDFNCILSKEDLDQTAQGFWDQISGLSQQERDGMTAILTPENEKDPKFIDVWRELHPTTKEYTHSSGKYGAWRLDSFILSNRLVEKARYCEIRNEVKDWKLSDHWPVALDITLQM